MRDLVQVSPLSVSYSYAAIATSGRAVLCDENCRDFFFVFPASLVT